MSQPQIIGERPALWPARASVVFFLCAAMILAISAVLQQFFWARSMDIFAADPLVTGSNVDPKQELFALARGNSVVRGVRAVALLVVASGMLVLVRGVRLRGKVVIGSLAAVVTAVAFGIVEVSAWIGETSSAHVVTSESILPIRLLMLVCVVGLLVAGLCWRRFLFPAAMCSFLLLGTTLVGSFIASVFLPLLLSSLDHEALIPWGHWVVLFSTLGAGVAMGCATGVVFLRAKRSK